MQENAFLLALSNGINIIPARSAECIMIHGKEDIAEPQRIWSEEIVLQFRKHPPILPLFHLSLTMILVTHNSTLR